MFSIFDRVKKKKDEEKDWWEGVTNPWGDVFERVAQKKEEQMQSVAKETNIDMTAPIEIDDNLKQAVGETNDPAYYQKIQSKVADSEEPQGLFAVVSSLPSPEEDKLGMEDEQLEQAQKTVIDQMPSQLLESIIKDHGVYAGQKLVNNVIAQQAGQKEDIWEGVKEAKAFIPEEEAERPEGSFIDKAKEMGKEIISPSFGFDKEEVDNADPKVKDYLTGALKYPAHIADSMLELGANLLFGEATKGMTPEQKEQYEAKRKEQKAEFNPSTPEEAKVMRRTDQLTNIATIPLGGAALKAGEVTKLAKFNKAEDVIKASKKMGLELSEDTAKQIAKEADPKKVGELVNSELKLTSEAPKTKQKPQTVSPQQGKSVQTPLESSPRTSSSDNIRGNQTSYKKDNNYASSLPQSTRKSIEEIVQGQGEKIKDVDIRKFREQQMLGEESVDEIILRKRGIVTDKQAVERASQMKLTLDDVINAPKGTVYNKEQLTAVSQVVQTEREAVQGLRQILEGGAKSQGKAERALLEKAGIKGSEEEMLTTALEQSTLKLKKAEFALYSAKSEAGRALQGTKQGIEAVDSRMRIVFGHLKRKTPLERQAVLERIAKEPIEKDGNFIKMLEDISEADGFDKFAEYATAIKLYNPTTHIVNFGSNTLRQVVDMGITGVSNPKTAKADIQGAIVGLKSGLKNAYKALTDEGYASTLSKYIEEGGQAPAIKGTKGKIVRSSFRALGAGDEIFRGMARERSLYRQANKLANGSKKKMKEILERPTDAMMKEAKTQADRMTFQEEMGELSKKINDFRTPAHYKSFAGKTGGLVARLFVPFLKTPTNLFKQAADFSPIGLIKNKKALVKGFKKGATTAEAEQAKRLLGEAIVGTATVAYISQLATDGLVTGATPETKKEREQFYAEGKIPYAIKVGDTWVQYNRVDPISTVVGLTADIVNGKTKDASELFNIVATNLSDKTYTKGMGDLLTLIGGEQWEREGIIKNQAISSILPGISGAIARGVDTTVRKADTFKERIQTQIPGKSKDLPARKNVIGEDIDRQKDKEGVSKFMHQMFNPIKTSKETDNPTIKKFAELGYALPSIGKTINAGGKEIELKGEDYALYSEKIGKEIDKNVRKMWTPRGADKEYQIKNIEEIRRKAVEKAKIEMLSKFKEEGMEIPMDVEAKVRELDLQPKFEQLDKLRMDKDKSFNTELGKLEEDEQEMFKKYKSKAQGARTRDFSGGALNYEDMSESEQKRLMPKLTDSDLQNFRDKGIIKETYYNAETYKRANKKQEESVIKAIKDGDMEKAQEIADEMLARQAKGRKEAEKVYEDGDKKEFRDLQKVYKPDPYQKIISNIKKNNTKGLKDRLDNSTDEDIKAYWSELSELEKSALRKTFNRKANKEYKNQLNKILQ